MLGLPKALKVLPVLPNFGMHVFWQNQTNSHHGLSMFAEKMLLRASGLIWVRNYVALSCKKAGEWQRLLRLLVPWLYLFSFCCFKPAVHSALVVTHA